MNLNLGAAQNGLEELLVQDLSWVANLGFLVV
jgi:hypothetical protein